MNVPQLRRFCGGFPGATEVLHGEPYNFLVYAVGGRKFAYFKTSAPERWRFSLRVAPDRFVELTDVPGVKPARYRGRFHWVTIVDVQGFPAVYLKELVQWSYRWAIASLSKAQQNAIHSVDHAGGLMAGTETRGTFDDILALAGPDLRPVCEALRRRIASSHKDFVEVVWPRQRIASFGVGPRKMSQHYAYIAVQGAHVNLGFYYGALLADPKQLLEGVGKTLRHIKLRDAASARSAAVANLLRQAIADRKHNAGLPPGRGRSASSS